MMSAIAQGVCLFLLSNEKFVWVLKMKSAILKYDDGAEHTAETKVSLI